MKCVNCEKEIKAGIEKCPYCGCQYPKCQYLAPEQPPLSPQEIDQTDAAKEVKMLIDTAVSKGEVSKQERDVILRTAEKYGLDKDVTNMMLDAALVKANKLKEDEQSKPAISEEQKSESKQKEEQEPLEHEEDVKVSSKLITPRFCRKCGNPLKHGARFCNKCGTSVM